MSVVVDTGSTIVGALSLVALTVFAVGAYMGAYWGGWKPGVRPLNNGDDDEQVGR